MNQLPKHHCFERKVVTLPRVFGIEQGFGYVTVEVKHDDDGRGAHMKARVKRRKVRRER